MFPGSQHFKGVEGRAGAPGEDQEEVTSFIHSQGPAQNQHQVVSAQLERFWCQDKPRATRTHKTHHGPDLGEATTFPLIVYFAPLHGGHIQMAFCPETPEIASTGTPATLRAHNFLCRPLIAMWSKAKLQLSLRAFQRYVARGLHARESGRFPTFNGQESNCQFDFRPFFCP